MKIAYADPPYVGYASYYPEKQEVDHIALLAQLENESDGWALSAHTPSLPALYLALVTPDIAAGRIAAAPLADPAALWQWCNSIAGYLAHVRGIRTGAWVKPFCSFKPGNFPYYAWEPIIYKPARKRRGRHNVIDFVSAPMEMRRGVKGAKPAPFAYWLFSVLGADPTDTLADLYPGSGAVTRAWEVWRRQAALVVPRAPARAKQPRLIEVSA